ncbi:tRNA-(ms[2]io[6]A)-hydroxylase [Legionella sp. W05-934-2]|jgi:tRNA-(ms[2]io[6]A)-hydroxylase|uniref:tRNA-(ms[2]io[6]A)-hydroxylase n=1 Tax=Legionella sp. W05-934-2 TaxID=1198649 RepID=UPI0034628CEF
MTIEADIKIIRSFLKQETPSVWLDQAPNHIDHLLIDHAHCERKAASTAINLIAIAPNDRVLVRCMSPLIREEMLHFEKVHDILVARGIEFYALPPSRYASHLHQHVRKYDTHYRLTDLLIIGAIIEARSCERFAVLSDVINDDELIRFYRGLIKAEARHFMDYIELAKRYDPNLKDRLDFFLLLENEYILANDNVFRFHSGPLAL